MINILDRIQELCAERQWSMYKLSLEAELPSSTLVNMFNRKTMPSVATLASICDAFQISMSEFFKENTDDILSDNEELLLKIFRCLEDKHQRALLIYLKELIK